MDRVQRETLRRDFQEASKRLEMLKEEKAKIESEAIMYQNLAAKTEGDLRSLSDAYNSLEQSNLHLENEVKALRGLGHSTFPDVEARKAEAREEALKESEGELNDLLTACMPLDKNKARWINLVLGCWSWGRMLTNYLKALEMMLELLKISKMRKTLSNIFSFVSHLIRFMLNCTDNTIYGEWRHSMVEL
ncbi:unnamed protein product [Trifolium pratense]|uniref:Uncharacterized protein n=1 Tax=Trifolium pratense TaxID=57577 RepID=A0ACB0LDD0_TRIPR|nr:unnamed protein product [Trifolium pratense]